MTEVLIHILSYLPAQSLAEIAFVSRRFHDLINTPHAWRVAFTRSFVGPEAVTIHDNGADTLRSERRVFARLTPLASWRSEFILRTWLLRSLAQGKPAQLEWQGENQSPRPGTLHSLSAQVTYGSNLNSSINHLHATFITGANKRASRFIHGADKTGAVCLSDPSNRRIARWGFADAQDFSHFTDEFPGDSPYGLGAGDVVGVPNSMDVSHPHGMIYAEGYPGGRVYFRHVEENRGRDLAPLLDSSFLELGIPQLLEPDTTCSVWIAKASSVPDFSKGLIGMLTGSSHGIVSSYSLGTSSLGERRLERGEVTARWVLCPGVPIIAIAIDENYSWTRHACHRIWAVVLNALGEVCYLTDFPERPIIHRAMRVDKQRLEHIAWETGRSVHWNIVGLTKRVAKPHPYGEFDFDGSYSPRGSWNGMNLSEAQIVAETREIETFMGKKPKHFRQTCEGWDMRRRLEVDFASSDEHGAGEGIVVIGCGLDEGQSVMIRRFTRCKLEISPDDVSKLEQQKTFGLASSLVDCMPSNIGHPTWSFEATRRSCTDELGIPEPTVVEEWRITSLQLGVFKSLQISTTAIDQSTFATLTASEDPLLAMAGSSSTSSPLASPKGHTSHLTSPLNVPGQRGRFLAAGTKTGAIIIWNLRHSVPSNGSLEGTLNPVCIIRTESPQISCLALSALYLVHGGNDGLVQTWDPLNSSSEPIRTLNSRFSSRARRRLIQAESSVHGVDLDVFGAGAICLDPDPTVLRGMVALGTQLRYWSYSSSKADKYKSNKRRLRRSERGSNQRGDGFPGTGRGALKDYIANEKLELEREKNSRRKEEQRLAIRFGSNLLGPTASEDELVAYARLLSQETAVIDEQRRKSSSSSDASSCETIVKDFGYPPPPPNQDRDLDADIAEAIRLSLQDHGNASTTLGTGSSSFSVRYAKPKRKSPSVSPRKRALDGSSKSGEAMDDLELALELSLLDVQGMGTEEEEGLGLREVDEEGKGKGKAR